MAECKVCKIEGCCKGGMLKRGWCRAHYYHWLKYGDTSGVNTKSGEPRKFLDASMSIVTDECILWPFARSRGYASIYAKGRMCVASRLVCEAVHGAPKTPQLHAAHMCGNGHLGCVNWQHLAWKTAKENNADKITHGTTNRGDKNGGAKLSYADVHEIKRMSGVLLQRVLAAQFGVSQSAISAIQTGRKWEL